MTELPEGWLWTKFAEVANVASDLVDPGTWPLAPHVAPNHIESGTGRLAGVATAADDGVTSPKHRFRAGQVLYSKIRPYLAKVTVAPYDGLCSADMYPIDAHISARFLLYWMLSDSFTESAAAHQGRSVLPKINQAALNGLPVPVAPLSEQERIVAAIEEAFSKLDAGEAGLRTVRRLLTRARDAVLSSALTGRLLPQDSGDTSVAKILAEVGAEPVEPDGVPGLPDGWAWASLGSVADVVGGATKDSKKQDDPTFVERPYLRVANVQRGYLDLETVTTIRVAPEKAAKLELRAGDVLFNEGGDRDKLGRGWVWEGQVDGCIHQNHVFRARVTEGIEPKLVSLWGNTFGQGWFEAHGKQTTNLASINMTTLKSFPIPVAPEAEQRRILDEVERQVSFVEACERSVDAGLEMSAALRRAVLKAAFEGRLVPQDPTDEPASVLLERIRAERAAAPKPKQRRARATA